MDRTAKRSLGIPARSGSKASSITAERRPIPSTTFVADLGVVKRSTGRSDDFCQPR
jgi:hypothetical protein